MKPELQKVPITERALYQRVNRVLAKKNEMIRKSMGKHFIVDLGQNTAKELETDVETFGRKIGCLEPWEKLAGVRMGYGKGVFLGHAGGHLREPVLNALDEWYEGAIKNWWESKEFGPENFYDEQLGDKKLRNKERALKIVGKLWHCKDILPSSARDTAKESFNLDSEPMTYAQLARLLLENYKETK
jgi:hypothetical protein